MVGPYDKVPKKKVLRSLLEVSLEGNFGTRPKKHEDPLQRMGINWVNWDLCMAAVFLGSSG